MPVTLCPRAGKTGRSRTGENRLFLGSWIKLAGAKPFGEKGEARTEAQSPGSGRDTRSSHALGLRLVAPVLGWSSATPRPDENTAVQFRLLSGWKGGA